MEVFVRGEVDCINQDLSEHCCYVLVEAGKSLRVLKRKIKALDSRILK